jgi:sensor histidine kinase YesM
VRSIDARGKISKEIILPFVVRQAYYKTWWFFLLIGTALGLLVFGAFRLRLRREREVNEKERLEYKSRLLTLEQRSLNASMNRHFIFNSLNSIQYFINTQDKLSANRFLTNFAKLIRKNLDSSEEGNMVTLSQEIERLDLYLSLECMRFKDRFDYKIDCDPTIDMDSVVIPAMILQPFVENSIIHGILPNESQKGLILVKLFKEADSLLIEITDNGIGIDQSIKNKSAYDGDHRSQGMEITTKRIELLNKLSDLKFEIKGPFQIEDDNHSIKGTGVILKMQAENLED